MQMNENTLKLIVESIATNMANDMGMYHVSEGVGGGVQPEAKQFVDNMFAELDGGVQEDESDLNAMKAQVFDYISKLKTKEDFERFIADNKDAMNGIQNSNAPSKTKKYLGYIWKVICYAVKSGKFVFNNLGKLTILAAMIFMWVKFNVSPIQAASNAYHTATTVYQEANKAIDKINTTVDKVDKVHQDLKQTGEKVKGAAQAVGDKFASTADTVKQQASNMTSRAKETGNRVRSWFRDRMK